MGERWAVVIGINGYHASLGALKFCNNDAKLMQETLVSEYCGFAPENVVILTDDQPIDQTPTFGNIHSWLGMWLSRPELDDLVLVYFAGHGRQAGGKALLAALDSTLDSLPVTGIPIQNIRDLLKGCRANQKVLILDACHSGGGRDVATMSRNFRKFLDSGHGIYTIASCDADQISYEWPEKRHGVFTYFLVEAIQRGAIECEDGQVSLDRVYEWTRKDILDWTSGKRLQQEPVRICHVKGDIHITIRSSGFGQRLVANKLGMSTPPHKNQKVNAGANSHLSLEVCPRCGSAVERGWMACTKCAQLLTVSCGYCMLDLPHDSDYCPSCRRPVATKKIHEWVIEKFEEVVRRGENFLKESKSGQQQLEQIKDYANLKRSGTLKEKEETLQVLWTSISDALAVFLQGSVILKKELITDEGKKCWDIYASFKDVYIKVGFLTRMQLQDRQAAASFLQTELRVIESHLTDSTSWQRPAHFMIKSWLEARIVEINQGVRCND